MDNVECKSVALIGTGVMGSSMGRHLLAAGHRLTVHNRTREKAQQLLAGGAKWADSPGQAASGADVVITMVGYPKDVDEAYLTPGGILDEARPGALLVDMTTSSPALAVTIAEEAERRGLHAIDAPVSGGDVGARNATLTIMVGGSEEAYSLAAPLLSILGRSVVRQGGPGAGQHTKMANQVAIAGSMLAMVEMLAYASAVGLDPERVLSSVKAGSAASWSLENLAPRILAGDLGPGFYVKHFVKDLKIALDESQRLGVTLPGLELAERLYERLADAGGHELGTQALSLLYGLSSDRTAAGVAGDVDAGCC